MPRIKTDDPERLVTRIFWLAWQAVGRPFGMGLLQDSPEATEIDVWRNAHGSEDYAGSRNKPGDVYGDYVFGRMLKLGIKYDEDTIALPDSKPELDYQAWCNKYPTYQSLADAAVESLALDVQAE